MSSLYIYHENDKKCKRSPNYSCTTIVVHELVIKFPSVVVWREPFSPERGPWVVAHGHRPAKRRMSMNKRTKDKLRNRRDGKCSTFQHFQHFELKDSNIQIHFLRLPLGTRRFDHGILGLESAGPPCGATRLRSISSRFQGSWNCC